ncbi:hypothetical protein KJ969_03410 [Patescibacteria group bacterium]|nr:hypothetical protein [Patescibacteria group bacterium]MBU1922421.1 hypothetical protein [Patescibacteria group bacterium]
MATEVKGWPDWESWRSYSADFIKAKERDWKLYEIKEPNEAIPNFVIGPWQGWQENFERKNVQTFEYLVKNCRAWVEKNGKINKIKNDFPEISEFIGILIKETGEIVLFEGSHRAAAIALAKEMGQPIQFKNNPTIAIAEISRDERDLLEEKLKRGTHEELAQKK